MRLSLNSIQLKFGVLLAVLLCFLLPAQAQTEFNRRYATTTTGAMVMTGNTLGLNKASNALTPGNQHSIGVYTSTVAGLSAPGWDLATYGPTTLDYTQNGSTARFLMPSGSRVRYAELIWGGLQVTGTTTVTDAQANAAVTLAKVTNGAGNIESSSTSVIPDIATRYAVTSGTLKYYVRSANVTSYIQANGAGFYACKGVRTALAAAENSANCAGWTLAVIYENDALPTRNMTIFVGADITNTANSATKVASVVRGFCTAPFGSTNLKSRLAVSAMEGDTSNSGDQFLFGTTASLTTSNAISNGNENPLSNFFTGRINTSYDGTSALAQNGTLDTSGTAGTRNHPVGSTNGTGVRQGWDVTNLDVSAQMVNNQQAAYFRGTSSSDEYTVNAAALQIDVGAPKFPIQVKVVDKAVTYVGDTLTYTVTLDNTAGTADALDVRFYDNPPSGTSYISNSFRLQGTLVPGADPRNGIAVGNVPQGTTKTVSFQVRVNDVPPAPAQANFRNTARWTYEFQSCSFESAQFESLSTNEALTTATRFEPVKSVSGPNPGPQVGDILTWTMRIPNTGTTNSIGTTLQDSIPAGVGYISNSTTLNGVLIPDLGTFPFASPRLINSPGSPSGVVTAGDSNAAVVVFRTIVQAGAPSTVTNLAYVDPDGASNPSAPIPFGASIPAIQSDLQVTVDDGKTSVGAGATNSYAVTVKNNGPQSVSSFDLFLDLPPALLNPTITPSRGLYNAQTGVWTPNGGADLFGGQSVVFTVAGTIDANQTDNVVLSANVSPPPGIFDGTTANNSASDTDTVTREADLDVTKTDNRTSVAKGGSIAYSIAVKNNGPATLEELTITDVLPASILNPIYTPSSGYYNQASGLLNGISLPSGDTITLVISGQVSATASGTISNTATVSTPTGVTDPVPANNSSTDTTNVGYNVSGKVYLDANSNAQEDNNEAGFNGTGALWAKLRGATGDAVVSAPVGADGTFNVSAPATGSYTLYIDTNSTLSDITANAPTGFVITETGTGNRSVTVTTEVANQNFGLFGGATISGVVFQDDGAGGGTANNGSRSGTEAGVGGAKIQLFSAVGNTLYGETYSDTAGGFSLSIPSAAIGTAVRLVKTNPAETIATGASVGTTGGTYTRATDTLVFTPTTGTSYSNVQLGIVSDNSLTLDGNRVLFRGSSTVYPHVFTSQTAGLVTFSLTETQTPPINGWSAVLYNDANGNGTIDTGENPVTGAITTTAGQQISLLVKVFAPNDGTDNATYRTQLNAAFTYANASPALSQNLSRFDLTTLVSQSALVLSKLVDKATAKSGDIIAYEITYTNSSADPLSNIIINDATPAYTLFVDAAFDTLPNNLTACVITQPAVNAKGPVKWAFTGTLAAGRSSKVRFRVKVE